MNDLKNLKLNWYMTRGISESLKTNKQFNNDILKAVERFNNCDWGELCDDDKKANNEELAARCGRVLARYKTCIDDIYIILDGDFITTTILFCDEY